MRKVVIYGAGVLGRILLADMERYGGMEPVAFTVDRDYIQDDCIKNGYYAGLPVVPFDEVVGTYSPDSYDMIEICGTSHLRHKPQLYQKAKDAGYHLANYISAGAYLESEIQTGDNNVVLAGTILGFDGKMGSGNLIRQNVYLGHNFEIGSFNTIAVRCTFGSHCKIGDMSYFALAMTASEKKTFGNECLIGMGSVVTKNVEEYAKAYGNPAKVVSSLKETGVIL